MTGPSPVLCERRAKPRRRTPLPKWRTTLGQWTGYRPDLTKRTSTSGQPVTIANFTPDQQRRAVRPTASSVHYRSCSRKSPRLRLRRRRYGRRSPRGEARQQRTRRASWRQLSADEVTDQREGLVGVRARLPRETVARAREVDALDRAARLLVGADERVGDRGRHVVVELRVSQPDRRQRAGLAGRHDARHAGLRHLGLAREVAMVGGDQAAGVKARSVVLPADRVAEPRERIGDRIECDDERDRFVAGAGVEQAVWRDDRSAGVLGASGLEPGEQRQLAAARAPDDPDPSGIDA